jgi:adenylosuccinate lyase
MCVLLLSSLSTHTIVCVVSLSLSLVSNSLSLCLAVYLSFIYIFFKYILLLLSCFSTQVWPAVIAAHIDAELPFMATEVILMQGVKAGGDRQVLHEAIREHSMAAGRRVKEEGAKNDLLERIAGDELFACVHARLDNLVDPAAFVGRSPEQVDEFLTECIDPVLRAHELQLLSLAFDAINV